jgi:AraC-like DNA-binding protein
MEQSLASADREAGLSMPFVRRLVEAVEQAGVPRAKLLRAAEIDEAELESPDARMPRSRLGRMFELSLDLTGDDALGLHWAEGLTASGFAPVSYLVAHSASLRHGFETLSAFDRLLLDKSCVTLLEQEHEATVRCPVLAHLPPRIERFSAEMMMTSLFLMLRFFSNQARPGRASFVYAAPAYRAEYERVFGSSVQFEQTFNGIVFDRALLDLPSPDKDEDLHLALSTLAERRVARLGQQASYAQRVHEFLVQEGWPRQVDMETVARSLGLSVRSLRRRLAAEGKSYKSVESEARATVAKRLLREKRCTIQEAAYELGFSDTTTFHRAFKLWTGTTPNAYREKA